jgi:hypothetical protein
MQGVARMAGLEKFSLASLATFDNGRIAANFDQLLDGAIRDCQDRPNDDKPRKLLVQIEISPVSDVENGQVICSGTNTSFQLKSTVPTRKTNVYSMGMRKLGKDNKPTLIYNNDSLDNVDQKTIFDDSE